jgi:hypothetical protein
VALHIATQSHLCRGSGEQHGEQGRQAEITLGAVENLTQLRACIAHVFQLLATRQFRFGPSLERGNLIRFSCHQQAIHHATAFLN